MDIQKIVSRVAKKTGSSFEVNINGTLGVVKIDEQIVFTSSGFNVSATVEAYLMGLETGLLIKK